KFKNNKEVSVFLCNHCINNQLYDILDALMSKQLIRVNKLVLDQYNWTAVHRAAHLKDTRLMHMFLSRVIN
ncbi:unnamed protein product, partial [Oppiella nova]